ncbi:phosphoribosylanthranilate isomerase [Desulfofustis limnaeus]|jgi:phosphoribosylanthranilate isomerase|uniref:N-(5'-phosphoribosyl)anthranilate isomerase n=1 Tax=Desulfofustis limnaeus TaxID=2740163 RepID=A0ABM7W905_9BACT|nr:phosphoribosylanthranilate isomerase [Desulfofustis limnaeus]MDX9896629.1 phosphoribosylanthranilate isomerase [Desulfofustis sp.]BDD87412.1 N-(5'-phosphoribosyl)anthranilate isomerase [Desulfofustis limnaeus]
MRRVRIKVCGITRAEDAEAAVAAGVDALGFIFVPESPRYLSPERAAAIIACLPPFVGRVGVFRDLEEAPVRDIVDRCGLTQVQLHGSEAPTYCRALLEWRRSLSVCKALRIGGDRGVPEVNGYQGVVHSILLDTYVQGTAGGTGRVFDWTLVGSLDLRLPLILAGGLAPDNVIDALQAVHPYAIDVNSGVETSPGKKDPRLLEHLVATVRRYELAAR